MAGCPCDCSGVSYCAVPLIETASVISLAHYLEMQYSVRTRTVPNVPGSPLLPAMLSALLALLIPARLYPYARIPRWEDIATDVFLGYAEKRNDNTSFHWNAQGYNRINPGVSGELGLQWKRISLLAEYKSNLADTFSKGYKL